MGTIIDICRIMFLAVMLSMAACQKYGQPEPLQDATLSIKIATPGTEIELKSVSSSPTEPTEWTAWERVVDGRYLYRVTAFLIQDNRLIASEDLKLTGDPSEAEMTFEGNFTHGTYRLMIVANYSGHEANDGENGVRSYEGLTDFTATVESLLEQTNIDNFTTDYDEAFLSYQLNSDGGICPRVPQALSLVKDIELHPGTNTIEGELIRTYSRIRISIENQSDETLEISSIAFSDIFTQKRAYLFSDKGYIQDKTNPDVDHPDALTPFAATPESPLTIPGKGAATIFDAYILESTKSSSEEEYRYTLDLGYEGTGEFTLGSTTAIRRQEDVSAGYYILYNTYSSRYLTAGSNRVTIGNLSSLTEGMTIPDEYVWAFDNSGMSSDNYYIGTSNAMETGQTSYFMNSPSNNYVTLVSNKDAYFYVDEVSTGYFTKQYYITLEGSNNRYLRVSNNTVSGRTSVNNTTYFYLYPVDLPSASTSSHDIPLNTIDDSTGQAVEVDEIKRNDFIDAVVLIKYNKNKGHFYFEVKDWNSAGGDVEFN